MLRMSGVNLQLSYDTELFLHPCIPFRHLGLSEKKEGRRDTLNAQTNKRSKTLKCSVRLKKGRAKENKKAGWLDL